VREPSRGQQPGLHFAVSLARVAGGIDHAMAR
jgi:hypothetical protein